MLFIITKIALSYHPIKGEIPETYFIHLPQSWCVLVEAHTHILSYLAPMNLTQVFVLNKLSLSYGHSRQSQDDVINFKRGQSGACMTLFSICIYQSRGLLEVSCRVGTHTRLPFSLLRPYWIFNWHWRLVWIFYPFIFIYLYLPGINHMAFSIFSKNTPLLLTNYHVSNDLSH